MRFLPSLLLFILASTGGLSAQTSDFPTVSQSIPTASIVANAGAAIDLRSHFTVTGITGQVVQFNTPGVGVYNVEMNATAAPATVANFLAYVNANRLSNTIVHRSDPMVGIIQGGSFFNALDSTGHIASVPLFPAINLETSDTLPNTAGTISMPRKTAPNSVTSGWFINVTDNSAGLPPASSGGYAVFGRVTGTGMTVVNAIAALPVLGGNVTVTNSSTGSPLVTVDSTSLPSNFGAGWRLLGSTVQSVLGNFVTLVGNANADISTSTSVPYTYYSADEVPVTTSNSLTQLPLFTNLPSVSAPLLLSNLVTQSSIKVVPIFPTSPTTPAVVTFSASSSDPIVNAWTTGSILHVVATKNLPGSSTVTVTATDSNGNASSTTFTVNVTRKVRDINGDTFSDLIFQNTGTGQLQQWLLNGTGASINFGTGSGIVSTGYLYGGSLVGWQLAAIGDLDGDGIPDLVFQNTRTGQLQAWLLNGTGASVNFTTGSGIKRTGYLYGGSLLGWRLAGIADVNGDGKADLIFQNTSTGQVNAWFLNGTAASINFTTGSGILGTGYLYGGNFSGWQLGGVGDVNGDGIPDLVFQSVYTGQVFAFALDDSGDSINFDTGNGTRGAGYIYGGSLPGWRLAGIVDMNGDGIPDLIFQNTGTGQVYAFFLNGTGASVNFTSGSGIIGAGYLYGGALPGWQAY